MSAPDLHLVCILALAMDVVDHVEYSIRREAEYPSRKELHDRLEYIKTLAVRGRRSVAQRFLSREVLIQ